MNTKKKAPALRDQILDFLRTHDDATLKQIAAATTERDYPSRVTAELNKLRIEAAVECEKKKGKNELWYWLAQATTQPQPAVGKNAGSSASDDDSSSAEGAAVHTQSAPAAALPPSAAPAAADVKPPQYDPRSVAFSASTRLEAEKDEKYSLLGVLADIRAAVGDREGHLMQDELVERVRTIARSADSAYADLDTIRATLQPFAYTGDGPVKSAQHAAQWIESLSGTNREQLTAITCASETLAPLVPGDIDTSDLDLQEIAERVAAGMADLTARLQNKDAELFEQARLVAALRTQLSEVAAERDAYRLRIDSPLADQSIASGYLVRAPKRAPRITARQETAVAAALAAARNGSGRGEVFALVPVGKAVRGAEWRPA